MNPPTDNSYIGITTPHVRKTSDFYVQHFGYSRVADTERFASVMAPNKKRCLGFSAPDDAGSSTPPNGMHLVFLVENAATALAEFRQRGVSITRGITIGPWGARHFVITDPAGVELFISERRQQAKSEHEASPFSASAPDDRSTQALSDTTN